MLTPYRDMIALIENMHRRFLEVVKLELDRLNIRDITNVQAMILSRLGEAEMTIGELTYRGCYLGSNITYNLKQMVANGYIVQERSMHDRRTAHVRLSEKGLALSAKIAAMHDRHYAEVTREIAAIEELAAVGKTLKRLERFWMQTVQLDQRQIALASSAA